jgi:hypothetical protein
MAKHRFSTHTAMLEVVRLVVLLMQRYNWNFNTQQLTQKIITLQSEWWARFVLKFHTMVRRKCNSLFIYTTDRQQLLRLIGSLQELKSGCALLSQRQGTPGSVPIFIILAHKTLMFCLNQAKPTIQV